METVVQQERLRQLARYLQEQLKASSKVTPLQVQCALKERLMVLVQHPPDGAPDFDSLFKALKQAILKLSPARTQLFWPAIQPYGAQVTVFVRALGQPNPYRSQSFTWVGETQPAIATAPLETETAAHRDTAPNPLNLPPRDIATDDRAINEQAPVEQAPVEQAPETAAVEQNSGGKLARVPSRSLSAGSSTDLSRPKTQPTRRSPNKSWLLLGGGLATVVLSGLGGYAVTRPCVLGSCEPLQTAQTLSQQSTQLVQQNKSEAGTQQANQQLTEAQRLIGEIPPWSSYYGTAQTLGQGLTQVLAAASKAEAATQKGEAATQSVNDWQAAESLWQAAIAQLSAISSSNSLYVLAQERLTAYRDNLAFTQQRITAEQESRTRLVSARKTAELAATRQNTAQQPQDWQIARSTWQVAINTLNQIPKGTMAHAEAQSLLESYQSKLATVGDRVTQEQQANVAYGQAQKLETQAKALQQKNQWSQATITWRNALSAAKQVPKGTAVSDQAQTLVATYSDALKQAEAVVKIRTDLDRVCAATETICSYTITRDVIKVRFLPSYERKVRTMGGMSWYARDYDTMAKINTHLASLGSAFQAVATNAGIPVEVYNSDNQAIGGFNPS